MIPFKLKNAHLQNRIKRILSFFTVILIFAASGCLQKVDKSYDCPTGEWKTSTPEEQGIDSALLSGMIKKIRDESLSIHSMLIVRNGRLVLEGYFHPYKKDYPHIIFSATKSITALLIGLAVKEGLIKDEKQRLLDFFPQYNGRIANLGPRKNSLSLFHVLTMSAGFQWQDPPYGIRAKGDFSRLLASCDGVKYILDKPVEYAPGTQFAYNSGCSHLLAAIVQRVTGTTALQYAEKKLFAPLGISQVGWGAYHQGINNGGSEMFLKPRDMAKIGLLVLNNGKWNGCRVLPAFWVEKATGQYIRTDMPLEKEEYGYQWYTKYFLGYKVISAEGLGGNFIFIIPELDLVVVFTGGLTRELFVPYQLLKEFILPAVKSVEPLQPNPELKQNLDQLLQKIQTPEPGKAPESPVITEAVSGQIYDIREQSNLLGIKRISVFFREKDEVLLKFLYSGTGKTVDWGVDIVYRTRNLLKKDKELEVKVGLDNRFRTVLVDHEECGRIPFSARASWKDEQTLILTILSGWSIPEQWALGFTDKDNLSLFIKNLFYETSITGRRRR